MQNKKRIDFISLA